MSEPEVPEKLPCPKCGQPSKVLRHNPLRFTGINPAKTRVIQCDEHWRQKVSVEYNDKEKKLVHADGGR